jgi:hypothetical protein
MSSVERLNRSRGCTVGTVCVGNGCTDGAPESWSIRRWVGGCRGRWGREMRMGGELLHSHEWSGGIVEKPPSLTQNAPFWLVPKRCILDPTWRARPTCQVPKRCVLGPLTAVTKSVTTMILF